MQETRQETGQDDPAQNDPAAGAPETRANWWRRMSGGLKRSSSALGAITDLVGKRFLDEATLEEIHDGLIRADLGIETAARITQTLSESRQRASITPDQVKAVVAAEVEKVLAEVAQPLAVDAAKKPFVILVAGVNGSGKTTTIGKLSAKFRAEGKSVLLAAGDTFRAAAIEQLKIWSERTGSAFLARAAGSDPAGLAFDAIAAAKERGIDIVLIDTAGRLQNRAELMEELHKIVRVVKKVDASAPHAVLLVLDATVGQNALSQVEIFQKVVGVTGLVMTKLDGTARGGILVAIAARFKLPVHFIGVGEGVDDLSPFSAHEFGRAIAGLDV
jgi:fused signal recognition particle receptor